MTVGCVAHSTRGNAASDEDEFQGAVNWLCNPASQVSAHVVIATDGRIAELVDPSLVAWHALEANQTHLGAELTQRRPGDHITDAQVRSFAWWLRRMSARFGFPLNAATVPEHKDIPAGRRVGKSDIGADYAWSRVARFL